MADNIEKTLRDLGLTEGEIKVYYALVGLGESTVGPIIKKSGVSSSKVYVILDKLIEKGLVSYISKEKTKYFRISRPIALVDYVEKQKEKLSKTEDALAGVIEQIGLIQKDRGSDEEARIYRGYSGLKTGMFEAIKSIPEGGEYCFFSTGYGEDPYLQQFFRDLVLRLKERKIKVKGLAHVRERKLFSNYYKKFGYSMKYMKFAWPSDITISGDFLLILVWDKKEPVLYSIQSSILVNSYLGFFRRLWDEARFK